MTSSANTKSGNGQAPRYIGRLAPSPTGLLHLGHVRTFAIAAARARAAQGKLLLRIDDLDPHRSRLSFIQAALEDLRWLGLEWEDEPYLQSQQQLRYRATWEALVASGSVYPCYCSRRMVEQLRLPAAAHAEQDAEPVYPGTCRPLAPASPAQRALWAAQGPEGSTWRFRLALDSCSEPAILFVDRCLGPQSFIPTRDLGDFAIWRRDGIPAYQLASVVDDAALGITEVVRGADLLLSTARQLFLFAALGHTAPRFYHCPLVVDEGGRRLAKRADALSVRAMRERGLTPAEVLALADAAAVAE